jgi:hypothetical protein
MYKTSYILYVWGMVPRHHGAPVPNHTAPPYIVLRAHKNNGHLAVVHRARRLEKSGPHGLT